MTTAACPLDRELSPVWDYLWMVRETRAYPARMRAAYPIVGLVGETGEICNQIAKHLRGDDGDGPLPPARAAKILGEVGGALWCAVALAEDLDIDPQFVASEAAHWHDLHPVTDPGFQLAFVVKGLARAAHDVCRAADLSMALLASKGTIPFEAYQARVCALGGIGDKLDMLGWHLAEVASCCGSTLGEAAAANAAEIRARKARGTIRGDGDGR